MPSLGEWRRTVETRAAGAKNHSGCACTTGGFNQRPFRDFWDFWDFGRGFASTPPPQVGAQGPNWRGVNFGSRVFFFRGNSGRKYSKKPPGVLGGGARSPTPTLWVTYMKKKSWKTCIRCRDMQNVYASSPPCRKRISNLPLRHVGQPILPARWSVNQQP